jgi:hypothetical protein
MRQADRSAKFATEPDYGPMRFFAKQATWEKPAGIAVASAAMRP